MDQFPSPMTDWIRAHKRIEEKDVPGVSIVLNDVLSKPVEVFFADEGRELSCMDLLIHFHGLSYVPKHAGRNSGGPLIVAVVNLGSGSGVYENAFRDESTFPRLIDMIRYSVSRNASAQLEIRRVYLSSFSAGYGAVRAILRDHQTVVDGILLLDGLHTDYVPSGRVLSQGGTLNVENLRGFLQYAQLAMDGKKRFVITHSEIFPGTYASTTETADYLIDSLHLQRHSVLEWGPVGMQMLSETHRNGLTILGFAGNSAPDHIDHFHGLPAFLQRVLNNPSKSSKTDGSRAILPEGMIEQGNIDLTNRPVVRNPDGSVSTIRSLSVGIDGQEILIPTVSEEGRIMSDDEAVQQYRRTGRHLGKFNSSEAASRYAVQLHEEQERLLKARDGTQPEKQDAD